MSTIGKIADESLHSIKLGVVAIFGIIAPGVWFCCTAFLYVSYLCGAGTLADLKAQSTGVVAFLGPTLGLALSFLVVYVVGSVLRILPPDLPDRWSPLRKDRDSPILGHDRFPYEKFPEYLRSRGLVGLARLVPWDAEYEGDGKKKRSKTFVHYVKLYIAHKDPDTAQRLARQEAFIRLMSGVFYAVITSTAILPLAVGGRWIQRLPVTPELFWICVLLCVLNVLILFGILWAFHYQRLRELVMILSAYFIVGPDENSPYRSRSGGPAPEQADERAAATSD